MKVLILKKKAAALAVVLCVLLASTGAYAVFTGGTVRKLPIYSVETEEKKISISFDCAWGTDYTDALLEVLERENVRATFFMVEFWAEKYPEYVKKIDEKGHEIGTHSATHSYMSKLGEERIREEIASSSQAIEAVTGKKTELFRPPYGDYDDLLIQTVGDMGLYSKPRLEKSVRERHRHARHKPRAEREHHPVPQQRHAHGGGASDHFGYA